MKQRMRLRSPSHEAARRNRDGSRAEHRQREAAERGCGPRGLSKS